MTPDERARRIMAQGGQILLPFTTSETDTTITFTRTQLYKLLVDALNRHEMGSM